MKKTEAKNEATESEVADIISTLAELDRGHFAVNAGRKWLELSKAIAEVRGSGSLTIKLKVKPVGVSQTTGKVNQFEIKPEVSIDKPEHPLRPSLFFVTEDARLSSRDPDQEELFSDAKETRQNG